jgi:DNA primase
MAGRIKDSDVAYVRDHSHIDEVVGDYVQLKNAGGGQKKGLCPFHDEKSPSFHVTPSKGFFHCFGCQTGGDVIAFLMKIDHLTFTEAVERLAERIGYQLTYETNFSSNQSGNSTPRNRLVAANTAAADYYQAQLQLPNAQTARDFLQKRGFDKNVAADFGIGYAPDDWDCLYKELKKQSFTDQELNQAGLIKEGTKGFIDRYRNRLIWPVKDISGDIVGFGARKLASDEVDTGPKYLNSPETAIYKKNQILYGLDIAKKEIAKTRQVVIVEGYTDVMAAHLSGVKTAIATCGTAFGDEHIRIIRRLLMDDDTFRGEVIFTFDGDAAGQKAALRAFSDDQKFVAQTFVAVEPNGLDPCELRQAHGDSAVRDLVARRIPLFEFAIKNEISKYDLNTAEGRVNALNQSAPLIARIKDASLRPEYVRLVSLWLGLDIDLVSKVVKTGSNKNQSGQSSTQYSVSDPVIQLEREVLKIKLQRPDLISDWPKLEKAAFVFPIHQAIRELLDTNSDKSIQFLLETTTDAQIGTTITALTVEPIRFDGEVNLKYAGSVMARLREVALTREIAELKSQLQRINPVENESDYQKIFADLVSMEAARRVLKDLATSGI